MIATGGSFVHPFRAGTEALRIKPGDKLEYVVEGDHVTLRVHLGTRSLKGALASKKGKGMSFAQIRKAAAKAARRREGTQ
jgi:hypothetical protein